MKGLPGAMSTPAHVQTIVGGQTESNFKRSCLMQVTDLTKIQPPWHSQGERESLLDLYMRAMEQAGPRKSPRLHDEVGRVCNS
jgi:hypothetical protein